MEETEAKQNTIDLNEVAAKKARQQLAATMANNSAFGPSLYNPREASPEEQLADALGNLSQMLRQLSHQEHPAIHKIRNAIKETIKELV